ncbi:hypothetical protein HELRODRAFT_176038 [Helobdella robusta]|uniref:Neurotransmitter-gated ion-channel transmembrane domain-containing protein n=1 Tax=Helobdella robusta TaxID=6412 RepID=T1FA25_HELRO|nr:hypothetical protein HELRODRAFT_176038 [Helobdella robusta]ESO00202.1 hypothetical protein HELRODRAFT_176038 [Helobdella robusta]
MNESLCNRRCQSSERLNGRSAWMMSSQGMMSCEVPAYRVAGDEEGVDESASCNLKYFLSDSSLYNGNEDCRNPHYFNNNYCLINVKDDGATNEPSNIKQSTAGPSSRRLLYHQQLNCPPHQLQQRLHQTVDDYRLTSKQIYRNTKQFSSSDNLYNFKNLNSSTLHKPCNTSTMMFPDYHANSVRLKDRTVRFMDRKRSVVGDQESQAARGSDLVHCRPAGNLNNFNNIAQLCSSSNHPPLAEQHIPRHHFDVLNNVDNNINDNNYNDDNNRSNYFNFRNMTAETSKAIEAVRFIADHLRSEDAYDEILDDWRYIASVIDRLQLIIFLIVTIAGTAAILFNAPHIFEFVDQEEIRKRIMDSSDGTLE